MRKGSKHKANYHQPNKIGVSPEIKSRILAFIDQRARHFALKAQFEASKAAYVLERNELMQYLKNRGYTYFSVKKILSKGNTQDIAINVPE